MRKISYNFNASKKQIVSNKLVDSNFLSNVPVYLHRKSLLRQNRNRNVACGFSEISYLMLYYFRSNLFSEKVKNFFRLQQTRSSKKKNLIRIKGFCFLTGRNRGIVLSRFNLSRILFRQLITVGKVPSFVKAIKK